MRAAWKSGRSGSAARRCCGPRAWLASPLGAKAGLECDRAGRIVVNEDLSVKGRANVFAAGDQASFAHQGGKPLPGVAQVAIQEGRFLASTIRGDVAGKPRGKFRYKDKGQMATIGRSSAIVEIGSFHLTGFVAWLTWLAVHIYFLTGFKNRLIVVTQWAWSYMTFRRGARLIVNKEWRFNPAASTAEAKKEVHPG